MELMTLDANNQPSKLIEGWDSLIWAERYNTTGDFQLQCGDISKFMTLLPEGTRVTLRDSNVPMIVETHQIERKKNQPAKLIIPGRSFESILDRRVSIQSVASLTGSNNWTVNVKTPSDLAHYIMVYICVDGDVDPKDIFPPSMVQFPTPTGDIAYLASTGPTKPFDVPRGNLLATVLGLLQTAAPLDVSTTPDTPEIKPVGIRSVRPSGAGTAIAIQLYAGVDRSATVYFDATRDLLDDGTYLFSKVGSGNVAYGVGEGMAAKMFEGAVEPEGMERRVILVDASQSGSADVEVLRHNMSQSLAEARETALFDGSINQDLSPYVFGVDYGLGDIVQVQGDYGLYEKARVTEYIRSQDATGYKQYPTLTTIID